MTQTSTPTAPRKTSRLTTLARLLIRVEIGYAILLLSAFVLPEWTNSARVPALVFATILAAGHALLHGRRGPVPVAILVYMGIYLLACVVSDREVFDVVQAGQLLVVPIFALAVAWAAREPETRRNLIALSLAAVAIQIPVTIAEVIDVFVQFGHAGAVYGADSITGLAGDFQASTVGQAGLFAAALMLAAGWVGAVRLPWALTGVIAFTLLSALTSTRVSYLLAPLTLLGVVVGLAYANREALTRRVRVWVAAALAIAVTPMIFLATEAIYPGANDPLLTWAGLSATLHEGDLQLGEAEAAEEGRGDGRDPGELTALPGRQQQLEKAVELSADSGLKVALLGRGVGASELEDPTAAVERPEQQTNGIWLALTIAETGWLGAAAFALLLGYLLRVWWRNRRVAELEPWDAAAVCALPGLVVLTALSALYNPVLDVRAYAALFSALLGIAIAIDGYARSRPPVSSKTN